MSIPILTSVTAPAERGAGLARLVLADADRARPRGQDQRHVLPHHHLGRAAGHGGGEIRPRPGLKKLSIIHVNNDFGVNMVAEFRKAYKALGGKIVSDTPYNENQASYQAR